MINMGLLKSIKSAPKKSNANKSRRKSLFSLISPSDVTEDSLDVWRHLPSKIRHDPSMVSFQLEEEKLHSTEDLQKNDDVQEFSFENNPGCSQTQQEDNVSMDQSEFITMNVPALSSQHRIDEICDQHPTPHIHFHHESAGHDDDIDEKNPYKKYSKMGLFLLMWILFTMVLTQKNEKTFITKQISIEAGTKRNFIIPELPNSDRITLILDGAFMASNSNHSKNCLSLFLQDANTKNAISDIWKIPIVSGDNFDTSPVTTQKKEFQLDPKFLKYIRYINVKAWTNVDQNMAIKISYDCSPVNIEIGIIFAVVVLIILYGLIIWEVVHRTFAAIISATMSIAILAYLDNRPSMEEIVAWMDVEPILLLFCMMILVGILTETGIFDYLAVYIYKVTDGKIWPLIHWLCVITALVSSFLDNVSTILLMTPITIRICEVIEIQPIPVLMGIIAHANIGGLLTPIGDPPNIIVTSNTYIAKHGVTFLTFTLHMTVGVLIVMLQTWLQLRLTYRNIDNIRLKEPTEIKELRREITVWERAAASLSSYSKDVDLVRKTLLMKVKILKHKLKKMSTCTISTEKYKVTLDDLQRAYPIKNKMLLFKSGLILLFIIGLFFIQSVQDVQRLSLGWSALLGIMLLLIITNRDDMDAVVHRIEWTTLLFFAALFITMEALERMGVIIWIGKITENLILSVSQESRLALAIIIILWVSAISSAFLENILITAMMIKIVVSLAQNETLGLPLQPLVWALLFGTCLGGNGTLIGSTSNVVCAGIAEQHGYKFSFMDYFKVGFPIMLGSVFVTTGYLMVSHVLFEWH